MSLPIIAYSLLQRIAAIPLPYLMLWCALLAMSVTLVVLMRSRWGQGKPLQKCAVLSLLVHIVFACLAMTVRVVVGDGSGSGSGPPIRVRIVDDSPGPLALAPVVPDIDTELAPPELFEPPPPEPPSESVEEEDAAATANTKLPQVEPALTEAGLANADVSEPIEQAPTSEPPADSRSETTPTEVAAQESAIAIPPTEAPHSAEPVNPVAGVNDTANEQITAVAVPPSPAASATPPAEYALRTAPGRLGTIESQGGNVQTEAAVNAGLAWLAAAQSPDGHWDADHFGAGRELKVLGHDRYGAGRNADTGITALALLAFLGAGHSHQQGDFQPTVRRGLEYLVRIQAADGSMFGDAEFFAQMYCHSMATFALAEAQAMTRDRRLEPAVRRAIAYCVRAQNSSTGGWRYRPGDTGDTSQLGWQMMALASSQRAGIGVPRETWTAIERFLRSVRRGNRGGLASYRPDSPASTSMTAEALYCRLLLSEPLGSTIDEQPAAEATAELLANLPDPNRVNLYYWYYGTLALHHRQQHSDEAAAAWHAWNDALTAVLLESQVATGTDDGSWNTDCLWGGYGGRVYTTAMATMCLEVYYRYAPAPKRDPWVATRPDMGDMSR